MPDSLMLEKIYNYCFRILSLKPYTELQMRQKIKGRFKEILPETVDEILNKLKELKYVDDEQFAINYINFRNTLSPRGKFVLTQELKRKGVAENLIKKVLAESEMDEIALAQKLTEHKKQSLQAYEPQKQKEKLMRFLLSRGFSYDVIKSVLKN